MTEIDDVIAKLDLPAPVTPVIWRTTRNFIQTKVHLRVDDSSHTLCGRRISKYATDEINSTVFHYPQLCQHCKGAAQSYKISYNLRKGD